MTTDSRIEELMKKGFGKLSFAEKAELNNLMAQNLQESKTEQFNKVVNEVKAVIEKNGLTVAEVVKALGGGSSSAVKPYFKVPYLDGKGKEKFYEWHPTKKAVGISAKYAQKLKNADAETKTSWATAEGKEWLKTDNGKRFLVNAE
ncbi:hypothetical protein [Achromobacter xylosoxidans]|uniref:hypothetical protein n=1 Tax=Alcaligenes xylosoxydans xylosoxydans TaxID=85698 RepID=UPI0006C0AA54|nr:hypothetical protein [Achromobacter xylosoxidans]CUI34349.1 Uncharacterised protein [Achromobacter xylosoxidans]